MIVATDYGAISLVTLVIAVWALRIAWRLRAEIRRGEKHPCTCSGWWVNARGHSFPVHVRRPQAGAPCLVHPDRRPVDVIGRSDRS